MSQARIGASRSEFEYEVPLDDAQATLALCDGSLAEKLRHTIKRDGVVWEIDEFEGENADLVVAEIELQHEDQSFVRPEWLGIEVTDDARHQESLFILADNQLNDAFRYGKRRWRTRLVDLQTRDRPSLTTDSPFPSRFP